MSTTKQTVVLVHGAYADSSSWNGSIDALQEAGHRVIAVANPLRGLESDGDYLRSVLESIDGPIVIAGHSYGGSVMSHAAEGNPNVTALVYVASFLAEVGESLLELVEKFPGAQLGGAAVPTPYRTPDGSTQTELTIDPEPLPGAVRGRRRPGRRTADGRHAASPRARRLHCPGDPRGLAVHRVVGAARGAGPRRPRRAGALHDGAGRRAPRRGRRVPRRHGLAARRRDRPDPRGGAGDRALIHPTRVGPDLRPTRASGSPGWHEPAPTRVQVASRRMATRSGMAEVELVEHDDDVVDARRPRGPCPRCRPRPCAGRSRLDPSAPGARRRDRRRRPSSRSPFPAALSVRAERARADALAGASRRRSRRWPPHPRWRGRRPSRRTAATLMSGDRAWVRDDVLVLWEQTGDRRARCVRVDAGPATRSGRDPSRASRTWETRPTVPPTTGPPASSPEAAPGQGIVVCLVIDSWQLTASADDTEPDLVEAATVRLRTFAAATGEMGAGPSPWRSTRPSSPSAPTWSSRRPGPPTVRRASCGSTRRPGRSAGASTSRARPTGPGGRPRPCSCSATRSASAGSGPRPCSPPTGRRPGSSTPTTSGSSEDTASRPWAQRSPSCATSTPAASWTSATHGRRGSPPTTGPCRTCWCSSPRTGSPARDLRHRAARRGGSTGRRSGRSTSSSSTACSRARPTTG